MNDRLIKYKERLEAWLFSDYRSQANLIQRVLLRFARVFFAVFRDIASGTITLHAMSLVYTSILSTVPLLALTFSLLAAFNVQDQITPFLYDFLAPMGSKGIEIYDRILEFVDNMKVGVLGAIGTVMLIYTVLSLIQKVEASFNMIWHVPKLRSFTKRFSNYLMAIILGPVTMLLVTSVTASTKNLAVTQYLLSFEVFGSLFLMITKLAPFFMVILVFFIFYMLMPNAKVHAKSALVGAIVAGITWETISLTFASLIANSGKYDAIYSGFAVGIMLLIWLYVNWLVLLLGSSISFFVQNDNYITQKKVVDASPELLERLALKVMVRTAECYEGNQAPVEQKEFETLPAVPGTIGRRVIDRLIEGGLLLVVGEDSDRLVPSRSTDQITLHDIYEVSRTVSGSQSPKVEFDQVLEGWVSEESENLANTRRNKTLRSLVEALSD